LHQTVIAHSEENGTWQTLQPQSVAWGKKKSAARFAEWQEEGVKGKHEPGWRRVEMRRRPICNGPGRPYREDESDTSWRTLRQSLKPTGRSSGSGYCGSAFPPAQTHSWFAGSGLKLIRKTTSITAARPRRNLTDFPSAPVGGEQNNEMIRDCKRRVEKRFPNWAGADG
jgi:hypothetical protein